ncbi:unnamed protein product [Strongylus vulgaris]|uniref:Uncharacterized protein n=1 Tax=Strongylus vulgaris TaxID=40348 RepID=A0A3P7KMW7_STRVU|nr:unnamed protein product [Strongylus vulgaris]
MQDDLRSDSGHSTTRADDHSLDELEPSTSRGYSQMSSATQIPPPARDLLTGVQFQDYDGDWRRSFPEWMEMIERDLLSAQTSPRQRRNRSDLYQSQLPENMRRVALT